MVGVAVFGALEDGMLNEVGDALLGALLVAWADVDIYSGMRDDGVVAPEDDAYAVV